MLRRAVISARGEMLNLPANGYTLDGTRKHLLVHRLLAFTFLLTPRFYTSRWSEAVHVDHMNGQHGDNVVENLQLLWAEGSDGHSARSVRQRFA